MRQVLFRNPLAAVNILNWLIKLKYETRLLAVLLGVNAMQRPVVEPLTSRLD